MHHIKSSALPAYFAHTFALNASMEYMTRSKQHTYSHIKHVNDRHEFEVKIWREILISKNSIKLE